jgi:hypothetical protein
MSTFSIVKGLSKDAERSTMELIDSTHGHNSNTFLLHLTSYELISVTSVECLNTGVCNSRGRADYLSPSQWT